MTVVGGQWIVQVNLTINPIDPNASCNVQCIQYQQVIVILREKLSQALLKGA